MEQKKVTYYEPQIDERVKQAQDRAQRILAGTLESEEDFMYAMILMIDREKRIGMFSDYYKNRTLDELVFEAELVTGKPLSGAEAGQRTLEGASKEAKTELGDWMQKEIEGLEGIDDQFAQDAKAFMETGNFKEPTT